MHAAAAQVGKPGAELPNPLLQNEVRDLQSRVAKLDAFFQAQIDLIPEWQKALGLIQNYKRQLDDHEQRMAVSGGQQLQLYLTLLVAALLLLLHVLNGAWCVATRLLLHCHSVPTAHAMHVVARSWHELSLHAPAETLLACAPDALSKEARGKADKVEGDLRELRNLDSQRWDVHDVAQRNLHTSIHKMTLDQQQFQVGLEPGPCMRRILPPTDAAEVLALCMLNVAGVVMATGVQSQHRTAAHIQLLCSQRLCQWSSLAAAAVAELAR